MVARMEQFTIPYTLEVLSVPSVTSILSKLIFFSGISTRTNQSTPSEQQQQNRRVNIARSSRSFKMSCPPERREARPRARHDSVAATSDVGPSLNASAVSGLETSRLGLPTMTSERIDSTYGTDSNRTVSPQDAKSEPGKTSNENIAGNGRANV